jgi:transposase
MNNTANMKSKGQEQRYVDLENKYKELEKEKKHLEAKLRWYEDQYRLSQQKRFGASSEKSSSDQLTLQFFNEAEIVADIEEKEEKEEAVETVTYQRKKQRTKREVKFNNLPVETVEYELPKAERLCPCCNGELHNMRTETREELKIIPAEVKVVKHVRHVYACRQCEKNETKTPIITASMPNPVQSKSMASPSIVAYVMSQKYVDSQPLYRQEKQFSRLGVDLSRQTMANWMIHGAREWLTPLYHRMHEILLQQEVLHADETTLQVLRESERAATTKSYLWLYRTGQVGPAIVLYEYQKTRGGEHPRHFLTGFKGYLHVDGYSGYHKVPNVTLVGCWAHARRKFHEALKACPESVKTPVATQEGYTFCNRLFAIEREIKGLSIDERYAIRQERSRPIVEDFLRWLKKERQSATPKGPLGQAIVYCLNQWDKLIVFLQDGRLELDNNRSERSIKPFVIGRKNWLFANTPRGAQASATIYSVIETAKENDLNPMAYLTYLFEQLPQIDDLKNVEELDKFLPWSDSIPSSCRMAKKP